MMFIINIIINIWVLMVVIPSQMEVKHHNVALLNPHKIENIDPHRTYRLSSYGGCDGIYFRPLLHYYQWSMIMIMNTVAIMIISVKPSIIIIIIKIMTIINFYNYNHHCHRCSIIIMMMMMMMMMMAYHRIRIL